MCTNKQLDWLNHVYLLHYGQLKLEKTKILHFDDHFQGHIWACGIGDTALKLAPLERAAQILYTTTKIVFETTLVVQLM